MVHQAEEEQCLPNVIVHDVFSDCWLFFFFPNEDFIQPLR